MKQAIWLAILATAVLTGFLLWWVLGSGGGVNGEWDLAESVELRLDKGDSFSIVTNLEGVLNEAMRGGVTYDPDEATLSFRPNNANPFTWEQVAVSGEEMSFLSNGTPYTIRKRGSGTEVATSAEAGEPVVTVFPFNERLASDLNSEGGFVEVWAAQSGFRRSHDGFEGANLYEITSSGGDYPFITVDRWASPEAFESFIRVFRTDAIQQEGYLGEGDGPGVYRLIESVGELTQGADYVHSIVLLEVPDDLMDTYMTQWAMFSDFMANQDGFVAASLHQKVEGSESRYDYFVLASWTSEDAFAAVAQSEFYQAIVGEGTYTGHSALYQEVAEDSE